MKKYITLIIFALAFTMNLSAQNDGFFSSDYTDYREEEVYEWGTMPALPEQHGGLCDYSAAELCADLHRWIFGGNQCVRCAGLLQ